jgi:hypothetical protein
VLRSEEEGSPRTCSSCGSADSSSSRRDETRREQWPVGEQRAAKEGYPSIGILPPVNEPRSSEPSLLRFQLEPVSCREIGRSRPVFVRAIELEARLASSAQLTARPESSRPTAPVLDEELHESFFFPLLSLSRLPFVQRAGSGKCAKASLGEFRCFENYIYIYITILCNRLQNNLFCSCFELR